MAALISCVAWNALTWFLGLPGSPSHGLVGGLIGATLLGAGLSAVRMQGLFKVLVALFVTPLISFGLRVSCLPARLSNDPPCLTAHQRFLQTQSTLHRRIPGAQPRLDDAQKAMGIIVLSLAVGSNSFAAFNVPLWVVVVSAAGMALGTLLAGSALDPHAGPQILQHPTGT